MKSVSFDFVESHTCYYLYVLFCHLFSFHSPGRIYVTPSGLQKERIKVCFLKSLVVYLCSNGYVDMAVYVWRCMYGYVCMYVWMYVRMYLCMYTLLHFLF